MTRCTIVVPWLDADLLAGLIDTCDPAVLALMLSVDNRARGRSIARAWNEGVTVARDRGDTWLVVCSTTIRFTGLRGRDLLDRLDGADPEKMLSIIGAGWHLHAIPVADFDQVGLFDEGFVPGYYEDVDWLRRRRLAGLGNVWVGERNAFDGVGFTTLGDAHSVRRGLVPRRVILLNKARYLRKWGGYPPDEPFLTPFDRPDVDWRWTLPDEDACLRAG